MVNRMTSKRCSKCGETKSIDEFSKNRRAKDGLESRCKVCRRASSKSYYAANREQQLARSKAYNAANREEVRARKKAHYADNREQVLAHQKAYYADNREQVLARNKAYQKERAFSAVYRIECGDALYIGQTGDFPLRRRNHLSSLSLGKHRNSVLQAAYDQNPNPVFSLVSVNVDDLDTRQAIERSMIERYGEDCCNVHDYH